MRQQSGLKNPHGGLSTVGVRIQQTRSSTSEQCLLVDVECSVASTSGYETL
jgi:hypothetical protein